MNAPRPLGSTYRLQLCGVGFAGAIGLVDYLDDLGVETLYLSPILQAVPGSTHGYDVVDPRRLDPALGTDEEFCELLEVLHAHHMRVLLDIVPNHMASHETNEWWWDTLRHGMSSAYAPTFDVDWASLQNKVLVPSLSAPLSDLVGDATWESDPAGASISIDHQRFPLAGAPDALASLAQVLDLQHYRLAYWRLSAQERNYRRFFDIDSLIGVQVEFEDVFVRTHSYLAELSDDERVAGWRVDHVDGLRFPEQYLERLATYQLPARHSPPQILVEKIVAVDEAIPESWPVGGTTGYEFMSRASGLLLDPAGYERIAELGTQLGGSTDFASLGLAAKREVLATSFGADKNRLTQLARDLLDSAHPGHDLSRHDIGLAVDELTVGLDVYRTYLSAALGSPEDLARLHAARTAALGSLEGEARRALALLTESMSAEAYRGSDFVLRWQQLTTAVMAKGVEDTATYRYCGLLSHADVGGDPDRALCSVEGFHDFSRARSLRPHALNATSTHDSKRSEDSRARLCALSELSSQWVTLVSAWHELYEGSIELAVEDELRIYQSWVCLWNVDNDPRPSETAQRIEDYAVKSAREAKRRTSWANSDAEYEDALRRFVAGLGSDSRFVEELRDLFVALAPASLANSLALLVLKCLSPGVPDFYQGTEYFTYTLTDPDNRVPVDFARRRALVDHATALVDPDALGSALASNPHAVKSYLTRELLQLRRRHGDLFAAGAYEPLGTIGPHEENVVAFARHVEDQWILACASRLTAGMVPSGQFALTHAWGETSLQIPSGAPSTYVDLFTGATIRAEHGLISVAECFSVLPVSVLVSAD